VHIELNLFVHFNVRCQSERGFFSLSFLYSSFIHFCVAAWRSGSVVGLDQQS